MICALLMLKAMDGLLEGSVFAYVSMYALLKDNWAEPVPYHFNEEAMTLS